MAMEAAAAGEGSSRRGISGSLEARGTVRLTATGMNRLRWLPHPSKKTWQVTTRRNNDTHYRVSFLQSASQTGEKFKLFFYKGLRVVHAAVFSGRGLSPRDLRHLPRLGLLKA